MKKWEATKTGKRKFKKGESDLNPKNSLEAACSGRNFQAVNAIAAVPEEQALVGEPEAS